MLYKYIYIFFFKDFGFYLSTRVSNVGKFPQNTRGIHQEKTKFIGYQLETLKLTFDFVE